MAKPGRHRDPGRPEWIVGILSAGLVALMLGYLILQAMRGAEAPPRLEVARQPSEAAQLRFAVRNDGTRAARDITVALRLRGTPDGTEKRTLTIDFVPGHSEVTGAFLLDAADRALARDLRIESWTPAITLWSDYCRALLGTFASYSDVDLTGSWRSGVEIRPFGRTHPMAARRSWKTSRSKL